MFIEQAYKGNNIWWRVVITALLTTGIFIGNFIVYFTMTDKQMKAAYDMMKHIPNNLSLVINLLPFVFLLGMLFVLVYFLNERNILTLTTSKEKVDFKRILFSFGLIVVISVIGFAVSYYSDSSYIIWNFHPTKFFILLAISLLLFPFQIGLEEYLWNQIYGYTNYSGEQSIFVLVKQYSDRN